jgi:AraC family transcriptional regulator
MRAHARHDSRQSVAMAEIEAGAAIARRTQVSPWDGVALMVMREDIRQPSDWQISRDEHTVIVHLGGPIATIETEVNGVGARIAALSPGEVSIIPGGSRYAARARGGVISYATLEIAEHALREAIGIRRPAELRLRLAQRDAFASEAMRRLAALGTLAARAHDGPTHDMPTHDMPADDVSVYDVSADGAPVENVPVVDARPKNEPVDEQREELTRMTMQALVRGLCGHLLLLDDPAASRVGVRDDRTLSPVAVRRVERYVQERLPGRLDVAALARTVDIDLREFFRRFRAAFHTTPARYIVDQRLRRAKWLLSHTRRDITTIALQTGFASHSHLTTTFRSRNGVTPRAFRAAMRGR